MTRNNRRPNPNLPINQRCPICNKPLTAPSLGESGHEDCLPFCSERCKLIDLGAWLDSNYRIAATPQQSDRAFDSVQ
ncbi:MAG: DNA gyrase inhibitor YacG [Sedimentisphaerales bacterium]|nr:DNA gyrase inhibitor YacG [Sedimentisphaerales bacterium]